MATTLTSTGITFPDATTQTTAAASAFPSGTLMLFQQTTAPTGWTKQTTHDNKALRVVTGTAGSGGTSAFTTVFASRTPGGSVTVSGGGVNATTLALSQIPAHNHISPVYHNYPPYGYNANTGDYYHLQLYTSDFTYAGLYTSTSGSGGSHTHGFTAPTASFSGTAMDFAVQYVDLIIASKN